jgi:DNA-binding transcriptional ArsR family regulator
MISDPQLDAVFTALADPTRRAILARLIAGEASVNELAAPFAISQPAISKHLKMLERAGLVTRSAHGTRRPVRIEAQPMKDAVDWLENFRRFWEQSYARLDSLLAELQTPLSTSDRPARKPKKEKPDA